MRGLFRLGLEDKVRAPPPRVCPGVSIPVLELGGRSRRGGHTQPPPAYVLYGYARPHARGRAEADRSLDRSLAAVAERVVAELVGDRLRS